MKKQIILLMTDTTRKDMVGCYGNKKMITPNLDALAQEGIRYENAYTCQPVCGPARSAIFTGTFPHTNGMVTNGVRPIISNRQWKIRWMSPIISIWMAMAAVFCRTVLYVYGVCL